MQEPIGRSLSYEDTAAASAGHGEMQTSLRYEYLTSNYLRAGVPVSKQNSHRVEGVHRVSRAHWSPQRENCAHAFLTTRSIGFHLFLRVHSFDRPLIPHTVHEAM